MEKNNIMIYNIFGDIMELRRLCIEELKEIPLCAANIEVVEQKWPPKSSYSGYVKNGRNTNGIIVVCSDMEFEYTGEGFSFCAHSGDTVLIPRGIKYNVSLSGSGSETAIDSYTVNFLLFDETGNEIVPDIAPGIICRSNEIQSAVLKLSIDCHSIYPNSFQLMSDFFSLFACVTDGLRENTKDYYPIRHSISWINKRWNKNDSIHEIAAVSQMSVGHLQRLFKKWSGMSPIAYRNMLRINHAKTMLRDTELAIGNIAFAVGFDDPLYFSKVFKAATGLSPREYRQQYF